MSEPLSIAYAAVPPLPPAKWGRIVFVPVLSIVAAWVVGAITNGISGQVSRTYFNTIVGWMYGGQMTWGDVVFQGVLESTAFSILLAFVVTLVFALATGSRATLRDVVVALVWGVAVCLACWLAGGLAGVAWTIASPTSFRNAFHAIASTSGELSRWGFVGGSIWGVYVGGLSAIVVSSIAIHFRYRRSLGGSTPRPANSLP